MEKIFHLGKYGSQLWTRDVAKQILAEATEIIEELSSGDALVIDCKGVEVFDYSFANEFFGKILLRLPAEFPGRFALVANLKKYTRENLERALESMDLVMIERRGKKLNLIGKANPVLEETLWSIAKARGQVTASELADKLDVNLNALNERLTKLAKLGLVRRESGVSTAGRKQYAYSVLT